MKWLIRKCGGQEKLTAFLNETIQETKVVDGIDLRKSRLGENWDYCGTVPQFLCFNGDWLIELNRKESKFELWWHYEEAKAIIITVRIGKNRRLELLSIWNAPDLIILG